MGTLWIVAWKDIRRAARSVFLLVFALVIPLLTAGVFYAAFGGVSFGDESAAVPKPRVLVVNLDPAGETATLLEGLLAGDDLAAVWDAAREPDPAAARAAVDRGEASAAVIIPAGFSAAVQYAKQAAAVELYQDPAQTVGSAIVRLVVAQVLDGIAGGRVAVAASGKALAARSIPLDDRTASRIGAQYAAWVQAEAGAGLGEAWLEVQSVAGAKQAQGDLLTQMISTIMVMMMIFFCFFTGASAAQSILQEQEDGTLPRLFTTPGRRSAILGGKMLSVLLILSIQLFVLLAVSALAFGIRWGDLASVASAAAATAVLSASFALFLTSFLKSTKQAGMVYGVVVNLIGWIGISRLFAQLVPGLEELSSYADVVSLVSPHGWAVRIWQESMGGQPVWITLAAMMAVSLILFGVGVHNFNRRFAG
ncbi:MAG: ABC transporter permease [Anaerolineales bacterium]|nr:ABC transporter permease [Anaerolineales bacterium]